MYFIRCSLYKIPSIPLCDPIELTFPAVTFSVLRGSSASPISRLQRRRDLVTSQSAVAIPDAYVVRAVLCTLPSFPPRYVLVARVGLNLKRITKTRRNEAAIRKVSYLCKESSLEVSAGATSIFNVLACPRALILGHRCRNVRFPVLSLELDGKVLIPCATFHLLAPRSTPPATSRHPSYPLNDLSNKNPPDVQPAPNLLARDRGDVCNQ